MKVETWALVSAVLVCTVGITRLVLANAGRLRLLDLPNTRSMHAVPTPRGGGIAIVVGFMLALAWAVSRGSVPADIGAAFAASGLLVAVVGFYDDVRSLPARLRLVVHFAAASIFVAIVGLEPALLIPLDGIVARTVSAVLLVVGAVWVLNLYNFMDGIDGFAASEAVFVCTAAAILVGDVSTPMVQLALALAAATTGFLLFNWPPARIFMGDVASGFLGLVLAGLAIYSHAEGELSIWTWLILLAAFVTDATVTLLHRAWRGERLAVAHRQHAYQQLARQFGHRYTVLSYLALDILILLPLAWYAHQTPQHALGIAAVTYAALGVLALKAGAGRVSPQRDESGP